MSSYKPKIHRLKKAALPKLLKDSEYGLRRATELADMIEINGYRAGLFHVDAGPTGVLRALTLHYDMKDPQVVADLMNFFIRLKKFIKSSSSCGFDEFLQPDEQTHQLG